MFAQGTPGKGKGGPPKNLKVLTPENYMTYMRSFVRRSDWPTRVAATSAMRWTVLRYETGKSDGSHDDPNGEGHQLQVSGRQGSRHLLYLPSGQTEPLMAPPAAN